MMKLRRSEPIERERCNETLQRHRSRRCRRRAVCRAVPSDPAEIAGTLYLCTQHAKKLYRIGYLTTRLDGEPLL